MRCSRCEAAWATRDGFLADPEVELVEYRTAGRVLRTGVFAFRHTQPVCGGEVTVEADLFTSLKFGPMFEETATGSAECRGYCLEAGRVDICQAICECAATNEIAAKIRSWPKKVTLDYDLILEMGRSYRRFNQSRELLKKDLLELVNLARYCPSRSNQQPLKYVISTDPEVNARIFPTLSWTGYLNGWEGPAEGERPAGYIVVLTDLSISKTPSCEDGIAAQTMKLGAANNGIGSSIIYEIDREALGKVLNLKDYLQIRLVLALGIPAEAVTMETAEGGVTYWRDEDNVVHAPKRPLEEILINPGS